tara:strand:+ start:752 stop:1345 length:594 start_codon:yes stop_codon:yes gene_type:complete
MKVVFLQDVNGVANGGDVKEVKNGFARNYLIPKNMAAPATPNNLLQIKKLQTQASNTRIKRLEDLKELAEAIDGTVVKIDMRAGTNEQLYGSVTGTMVADLVSEITGRTIDRQIVQLDSPIRKLGVFPIPIRLHPDISAIVQVIVHETGSDPDLLEISDGQDSDVEIEASIVVDSEAGNEEESSTGETEESESIEKD